MRLRHLLLAPTMVGALSAGDAPIPAPSASVGDLRAQASYLVGSQMAEYAKKMNLNTESLLSGISDVMAGKPSAIDRKLEREIMGRFQAEMEQAKQAEAGNRKETNKTWLAANAAKEGIKALPSGLQYQVLASGAGKSPAQSDMVEVIYTGRLLDGSVFDATERHGTPTDSFPVGGVIPGWTEALKLMKEGDKWRVYIPPELAYGDQAPPDIGPSQILTFDMELVKVLGEAATPPGGR